MQTGLPAIVADIDAFGTSTALAGGSAALGSGLGGGAWRAGEVVEAGAIDAASPLDRRVVQEFGAAARGQVEVVAVCDGDEEVAEGVQGCGIGRDDGDAVGMGAS